jgi:hypothetical protein
MDFRIFGLPAEPFAPLFDLSDEALARLGALRRQADRHPGFPCRVSLRDAPLGAQLLLLNYEHLPVAGPYRSRHAIYVQRGAAPARLAVNEVPESLRSRLLSVRAFDAEGLLLDAEVVPGAELPWAIERLLAPAPAAWLHVHNARHGCYAARVERA